MFAFPYQLIATGNNEYKSKIYMKKRKYQKLTKSWDEKNTFFLVLMILITIFIMAKTTMIGRYCTNHFCSNYLAYYLNYQEGIHIQSIWYLVNQCTGYFIHIHFITNLIFANQFYNR